MAARKSLKDQLAELSQPAPIDLDPEDALAANDPSHDDPHRWPSAIDDPVAREHYVDVAPSALRKLHDSVNDPKYDGIRTSRKHLYDDRSDHATDDEDVADNEEQQDGRSVPSHSESGTDEDEDEELHSPADDTDSQDEDESGSGSEHEHEHSPSRQDQVNEASTSLSQIDINSGRAPASLRPVTDITSNLRKTHEADKKKGKAVSRQIALWDTLLDARIQLHKAVTAANRLPLNFMVPVPVLVGEWHEEQIDGLFSSLLQP
ncbi:hypothetical protein BN946_scf185008.g4 [Trametes cinnabarina]|uniref:AATF leucine zipper-containing domain-containing protein n=1 Tax=Pycnoporus cinnabarinus TaxID=5643 RepID=A0A060SFG0_PYCCI|nr:hypothetical protein BN946_scf185008.g4 [Trametes cinnabarina]